MDNIQIAFALTRAADLIEPEGAWTQGSFSKDNGSGHKCFCLYGAVVTAGGQDPFWWLEENAPEGPSLIQWNDKPERTQAEVVAKLREAAAKARGAA